MYFQQNLLFFHLQMVSGGHQEEISMPLIFIYSLFSPIFSKSEYFLSCFLQYQYQSKSRFFMVFKTEIKVVWLSVFPFLLILFLHGFLLLFMFISIFFPNQICNIVQMFNNLLEMRAWSCQNFCLKKLLFSYE